MNTHSRSIEWKFFIHAFGINMKYLLRRFMMASNKEGSSNSGSESKRGFASMDDDQQREIASQGGTAAHEKGTAHEFDSEEAREAGSKSRGGGDSGGQGGNSGGQGGNSGGSSSSTRGGTSEQHAEAGRQSHKNQGGQSDSDSGSDSGSGGAQSNRGGSSE
jgi:hypothetical protein